MSAYEELVAFNDLRADRSRWATAKAVDLAWHEGPTLLLWAGDGTLHRCPLTPRQAHDIARRLVGFLGYLHDNPPKAQP